MAQPPRFWLRPPQGAVQTGGDGFLERCDVTDFFRCAFKAVVLFRDSLLRQRIDGCFPIGRRGGLGQSQRLDQRLDGPHLPDRVILCRSLDRANDKLVELLLAAEAARASGASRLTLVAPYLCYMRQDKAFEPGEVVSQKLRVLHQADD